MKAKPQSRTTICTQAACMVVLMLTGGAVAHGQEYFQPSAKEAELYRLIRDDAMQQRTDVVLDPRLCLAARKHAADTQARKFFDHRNPSGVWPNQRVLNEGYPLPALYIPGQNYVESMAGSPADTAAEALTLWKSSSAHSDHVFGRTAFYRPQIVFGIGQAPRSRLGYATYVFIAAPPPTGEDAAPTAANLAKRQVIVTPAGQLQLSVPQPDVILTVYRSPDAKNWTLERCLVIDDTGLGPLGPKVHGRELYRFEYLPR